MTSNYIKHLIECQCTLPIFKNKTKPVYHKIPVFSKLNEEDNLEEKYVICDNCDIVHKVEEVFKSEIKWGVEGLESLVTTKEDIKFKSEFNHSDFGNIEIADMPRVISLYGSVRKPTSEMLQGVDLIIYDIQDIGARFYTYISTLGMVMESASKYGVKVLVLDRPNPIGGNIVEGPILDLKFQTFVGYYPIPTRYGLTIGELALMINGEKWIDGNPELEIVKMKGWTRDLWYDQTKLPWVKPSPNIPDLNTAIIYPGMCLLEATNISEGRGTKKPFKKFGAPWINKIELSKELNNLNLPGVVFKPITFIPTPIKGMSNNPKHKNKVCHGAEIIVTNREKFNSVRTGMKVIDKIKEKYPTHLKIKTSGMNRLWGNAEFSFQASTNNINQFSQPLKIFNNRSKKYYLYE